MTDSEYREMLENRRNTATERLKRKADKNNSTLCWECKNMNCSWIRELIPVQDWTADETEIESRDKKRKSNLKSYFVHECPEYKK